MNFLPNDKILTQLNTLIEEWKNQFDNPPTNLELKFSINTCSMIVLNRTVICDVANVVYDSMDYDAETLSFVDSEGYMYEIGITWPFGEDPHLGYIQKSQILYCAS